MPPRPPRGRGPAIGTVRVPRVVIGVVVMWFVAWFVVITVLIKYGAWDSMGPLRYVVAGFVGAVGVLVPSYFSYAVGEDWVRRGNGAWVDITALTRAQVVGKSLRLRDARRSVTVPVRVLDAYPEVRNALAQGVRISVRGGLTLDSGVRRYLDLETLFDSAAPHEQ